MDREIEINKLLPELRDSICDDGSFWIHHPYMIIPFISAEFNNTIFLNKKKLVEKKLNDGDLSQYLIHIEKPYRLEYFLKYVKNHIIDNEEYWKTLNSIWIGSENIHQNVDVWLEIFTSNREDKELFMSEKDRKCFDKLPNVIKVYRGCTDINENGFSYTLDKEKALWFAKRFNQDGAKVIEVIIDKSKVFAYTDERSEKELIIIK